MREDGRMVLYEKAFGLLSLVRDGVPLQRGGALEEDPHGAFNFECPRRQLGSSRGEHGRAAFVVFLDTRRLAPDEDLAVAGPRGGAVRAMGTGRRPGIVLERWALAGGRLSRSAKAQAAEGAALLRAIYALALLSPVGELMEGPLAGLVCLVQEEGDGGAGLEGLVGLDDSICGGESAFDPSKRIAIEIPSCGDDGGAAGGAVEGAVEGEQRPPLRLDVQYRCEGALALVKRGGACQEERAVAERPSESRLFVESFENVELAAFAPPARTAPRDAPPAEGGAVVWRGGGEACRVPAAVSKGHCEASSRSTAEASSRSAARTAHRRSASSLATDSQLALFIKACNEREPLPGHLCVDAAGSRWGRPAAGQEPLAGSIDALDLEGRYERLAAAIAPAGLRSSLATQSNVLFPPLLEHDHEHGLAPCADARAEQAGGAADAPILFHFDEGGGRE